MRSPVFIFQTIQWLNQCLPKYKAGNLFCPLCIFHILELSLSNLPVCLLPPHLSYLIHSILYNFFGGLILLLHWNLMHNYATLLWRFYTIDLSGEKSIVLEIILHTDYSRTHFPLFLPGIITNCIYLNFYMQKSFHN